MSGIKGGKPPRKQSQQGEGGFSSVGQYNVNQHPHVLNGGQGFVQAQVDPRSYSAGVAYGQGNWPAGLTNPTLKYSAGGAIVTQETSNQFTVQQHAVGGVAQAVVGELQGGLQGIQRGHNQQGYGNMQGGMQPNGAGNGVSQQPNHPPPNSSRASMYNQGRPQNVYPAMQGAFPNPAVYIPANDPPCFMPIHLPTGPNYQQAGVNQPGMYQSHQMNAELMQQQQYVMRQPNNQQAYSNMIPPSSLMSNHHMMMQSGIIGPGHPGNVVPQGMQAGAGGPVGINPMMPAAGGNLNPNNLVSTTVPVGVSGQQAISNVANLSAGMGMNVGPNHPMGGGGPQTAAQQQALAHQEHRRKNVLEIVDPNTNTCINERQVKAAKAGELIKGEGESAAAGNGAVTANPASPPPPLPQYAQKVKQEMLEKIEERMPGAAASKAARMAARTGAPDGQRSRLTSTATSIAGDADELADGAAVSSAATIGAMAPAQPPAPLPQARKKYLIDPATIGRQVPLQLPVVPSKPTEAADTPAAVAESKAESSGLTPTPSIAAPTSLVAAPTSALVSAPVAVVSPIATLVVPDAAPVAFEEAQSASEAAALHQPAAEQPQAEEPVSPEFVKETTSPSSMPSSTTHSTPERSSDAQINDRSGNEPATVASSSDKQNTSDDSGFCLARASSSEEPTKEEARETPTTTDEEVVEKDKDVIIEEEKEHAEGSQVDETPDEDLPTTSAATTSETVTVTEEDEDAEERKAEAKKQREAALFAQLCRLEADEREVNLTKMIYGRDFMYCVRDMEQELSLTPCPLEKPALLELGICRSLQSNEPKKGNFMPNWAKNSNREPQRNDRRAYTGRQSEQHNRQRQPMPGGSGGNRKMPPAFRPSIERALPADRAVTLHKSQNAWKPDKVTTEDDSLEAIKTLHKKSVRSLVNKITPTSQKDLTPEFLGMNVPHSPALQDIVDILFDTAVEQPTFCPLYSELCQAQVKHELQTSNNQSLFRNKILARAQETFNTKTQDDFVNGKQAEIDAETDPKLKIERQIELMEGVAKFRRRKFGNINFIGQLFLRDLLSTKIVHYCLADLLTHSGNSQEKDEDAIACAVKLLEQAGQKIEAAKEHEFTQLEQIYSHLAKIMNEVSSKTKFMILNLQELRAANWKKRKNAETGPKKLDEIKKDIEEEQVANAAQRDAYERKTSRMGPGDKGPMHGGGHPKNRVIQRNSLDGRSGGGRHQGDIDQRRRLAANSSNLVPSTSTPKNMNLKQAEHSHSVRPNWASGATLGHNTGGGRTGGGGSGRTTARNEERYRAMDAARQISQGARSSSQVSVNEESDKDPTRVKEEGADTGNNSEEEREKTLARQFMFELMKKDKFGKPSVAVIFRCFILSAVTKPSSTDREIRQRFGHVLAICMRKSEDPKEPDHKADVLKGVADYCRLVVEAEEYVDEPMLWTYVGEVLINAVMCEMSIFEGPRPQLNDFREAFIEAGKGSRKPYELLVTVLRMMAELNFKRDKDDHATMSSMSFEELDFIKDLDEKKLKEALQKETDVVPGVNSLYELCRH